MKTRQTYLRLEIHPPSSLHPEPLLVQQSMATHVHTPAEIAIIHSVTVMQRFRTHKLASDGEKFGMTSAVAKAITFADLSTQLREPALIKVMKLLLHRVCVLTAEGVRNHPGAEETKNVNVRVFIASFMMAYHASNVFESINKLETDLQAASVAMLNVFDELCLSITSSKRGTDIKDAIKKALSFPGVLHTYLKAFQAWKLPDEAKIADRIRHALTALYQAEDHLVEGDTDTPQLRREFRVQQERLRSKLVQIAGEKALKTFDETMPRASVNAGQGGAQATAATYGEGGYTALPRRIATYGEGGYTALPRRIATYGEGGYTALPRRITNEQLAHELILDPTFKVDAHGGCGGENPVHSKIRNSFHVAFWKSLADDLRLDPPIYVRVLRVLDEIRDGIHDLASGGGVWKGFEGINDVIDIKFIQDQIENKAFEWTACVKLVEDVVSILGQLCHSDKGATKRKFDEEPAYIHSHMSSWGFLQNEMKDAADDGTKQPGVFCSALQFLLDYTKAVRIEVANSRLRLIAPVIKDNGVDYERDHFDQKLLLGTVELTRTRKWLRSTIELEIGTQRLSIFDLTVRDSAKSASYVNILNAGVVALITDPSPLDIATCPETLLLDVTRLAAMQSAFRHLVLVASVMVIVYQRFGELRERNTSSIIHSIAYRIMTNKTVTGNISSIVDTVMLTLEECTTMSDRDRGGLRDVLMKGAESNRPVPNLMASRLRNVLLRGLDGGATTETVFKDCQIPRAIISLIPHVSDVVNRLRKVVNLNAKVHATRYNEIIAEEATDIGKH
jgi:T-complex protein 11